MDGFLYINIGIGKAGSTTYAAIADSIITTTKEKTDKEISHDTTNALNTLSEIFDKKKIEEKQEYVNILSQVGYRLIGDIAGHKEVAGASYLYGIQENHEKFKSPYNAFRADVLDILPISAGMLGGAVGMYLGGPVSAFCIGTLMTGVIGYRVEQYKLGIERKEARDISDEKRANT